ncbi:MAG: sensor histidine kinase, partial [Pyrinomonadaceae bacterium]
ALRGYVREWSRNFDIEADFRAGPAPKKRLLPEIEVNVYRIAQECLNNVAKYAKASSIAVLLSISENELTLIIEDNGTGFDTTASDRRRTNGGLGLQGMQERANLLEGNFQIESTATSGTTVFVRIPAKFRAESAATG